MHRNPHGSTKNHFGCLKHLRGLAGSVGIPSIHWPTAQRVVKLLGQDNPGYDAEVRRQQCIYRYGSGGGLGRTTWVWRPRDDDGKHRIS